jgi:hypothetical protein
LLASLTSAPDWAANDAHFLTGFLRVRLAMKMLLRARARAELSAAQEKSLDKFLGGRKKSVC